MFIRRQLEEQLINFSKFFSVVALLGPRQSGKTTLARHVFSSYHYLSLENLDIRQAAELDPRGFIARLLDYSGVILDEFQNAPDLLSYLQEIVDREKRPGFFILTGSSNFLMNQAISQSLAGRVGILTLLPLSLQEMAQADLLLPLSEQVIFRGSYPAVVEKGTLSPELIYPSYIQTYLERDIRSIINVVDLAAFKKFLALCAGRTGQLLNVSALANDANLSMPTVNAWLSLLQASYIIFLLQPHHTNFNKRVVKTPKLYFYDTGIACSLLNIHNAEQLTNHYLRGALFENLIIADIYKQFFNRAQVPPVYFWRDSHGHEIDALLDLPGSLLPIEIKAGMTFNRDYLKGLEFWLELSQEKKGIVIYGGTQELQIKDIAVKSWRKFWII